MTDVALPLISVCVSTYQRADLLSTLLDGLARQTLAPDKFEVVVVDNDGSASACDTVQQAVRRHPTLSLRYEVESAAGIAPARNRTVALAVGELLAFIDDDERPLATWLADMLMAMKRFDSDAVFGPVLPHFPPSSRAWVIKSRFFERPRFPTGTVLAFNDCRTGNALVKASWLRARHPKAFDTLFARSGGEDLDFFQWLASQGGRLVWCDSAEVHEVVPATRQNLRYMLTRSFRASMTYWKSAYSTRSTTRSLGEAALGFGIGLFFALLGLGLLPMGMHQAVRRWVISAKGLGRIAALSNGSMVGYH